VTCPYQETPGNETLSPKTLDSCLGILDKTTGLTSEERQAYALCQSDRDNYKVEWEKRGVETDNLNQMLATRTSEKEVCAKDLSSSGTTNWILMFFDFLLVCVLGFFIVVAVRNKNKDASKMD
jgi:hypothetical protein